MLFRMNLYNNMLFLNNSPSIDSPRPYSRPFSTPGDGHPQKMRIRLRWNSPRGGMNKTDQHGNFHVGMSNPKMKLGILAPKTWSEKMMSFIWAYQVGYCTVSYVSWDC